MQSSRPGAIQRKSSIRSLTKIGFPDTRKETENKNTNLSREVTDDISSVTSPQCNNPLILHCSLETITNTLVGFRKPPTFNHLILVLNQKFNTLNWSSSSLRYGSRDTAHKEVNKKVPFLCRGWDKNWGGS